MIKERLIQVLENKSIAKEIFYKKIGMTSASFRGKARLTPLNSNAVANILSEIDDLNPIWLLTGQGDMLKNDTNGVRQNVTDTNITMVSGSIDDSVSARSFPLSKEEHIKSLKEVINAYEIKIKEYEERIKGKEKVASYLTKLLNETESKK